MLRTLFVSITVAALFVTSPKLSAEEPIEAFLNALQQRQYFDVALRYLDRMAHSDLAPASFKQEVDYRRGMLLVNAARATNVRSAKQARLDEARVALERFLTDNAQHSSVSLARTQLGNILVERARGLVNEARKDQTNRRALLDQANAMYEQAHQALTESRAEVGEQYKSLASKRDQESRSKLDDIKSQYVQIYLALARVLFEQAETVEHDPQRYKDKLIQAAAAFEEVVQKYRGYTAGVYALLHEGECYQLLGEDKRALTYFKELLQNEGKSTVVRQLKSKALAKAIDSWLKIDRETGPDRAVAAAESWWKTKKGNEQRDPAWLELRLALAKAYKQKSAVEKNETKASRALREAREIARELAKRRSPVQRRAQTLLVSLGRGESAEPADPDDAANFEEALDAAKKSLDAMKLATATEKILSSQLENIQDPTRRAQIEAKIEQAKSRSNELTQATLELYERAASLATETDADELTGVRYYLAYLYYTQQRYRRAAVLGGFIALRYSDSLAAKECAKVALAARQRLYQQASPEQRTTQAKEIAKIAQLIVSKWPNDPQAATALMTLLDVKLQQGDFQSAERLLTQIPEDAPNRAMGELRLGQAIWREYLNRSSADTIDLDDSVDALPTRAQDLLATAIERIGQSTPNESAIRGAMSLVQIHVESGRGEEAVRLLNHDRLGALTLVEQNSSWLKRIPGFTVEAYKTAIRAHVAAAANSDDSAAEIESAERLLSELRGEMKQQPGGTDKMIGIYVSLARDLERQLAVVTPASRRALSQGFESFLRAAAEGSQDIAVLNWVGATFYSLGRGMLDGDKSSAEAQRYFTEAAKAYGQVLIMAQQQPDALSKDALAQAKVRQAMALRQLGKYQDSVDLFAKVLNERNKILNIQVEAAKTLQQWGSSGNAIGYQKAILGDRPVNGRNLIWGWGRIAQLVSRDEKYRDTFHEARYNLALSRYRFAMANKGQKQKELLGRAKADILVTKQLFNLGNERQAERYETLLKRIQKSLGEPETGFSESP